MKAKTFSLTVLASMAAAALLLLAVTDAEATQYRTVRGDNSTWYNWFDASRWEYFHPTYWQWRNCAVYGFPLPSSSDEVIIQSQMVILNGFTVSVGTLRIGVADIAPASGWYYYPAYRHGVKVQGDLIVAKNTYVWDDTLLIDGGTMHNAGILFIGNNAGYQSPSTNSLDACRRNCPTLAMRGASSILRCFYSSSTPSQYSGGLVFWPGSIEAIEQGEIHLAGWLVGCDDATCPYAPTPRLFDLTDSAGASAAVFLDGSSFPAGTAAYVYVSTENFTASPNAMKFYDLVIDRHAPGETNVQFISHLEVHRNFSLLDGAVTASSPRTLKFMGALPATFRLEGACGLGWALIPDLNAKQGPLTLRSTVPLPALTVNNPDPNFLLAPDPAGAICGSLDILDGSLDVGPGALEVRGALRVGRLSPPLPATSLPRLDMTGPGTLRVSAFAGNPGDGDFHFEHNAGGSFTCGSLEVDGDFVVDNAFFAPSGSHTVVLSGNAGRIVMISNAAVPAGKANPTLILNNLDVAKTTPSPGDEAWVQSDLEIRGALRIISGILNWNTGSIGSLLVAPGPSNPQAVKVAPGAVNVEAMHIRVSAGGVEDVRITGLTLDSAGSGNDRSDIAGVRLYIDDDGDGRLDLQKDILIAGPAFFDADDGSCLFVMNRTMAAARSETWIVALSLYETAPTGATYSLELGADSGLAASGVASARTVPVTGAPVSGGEIRVSLDEAAPAAVPAPGTCGGGVFSDGAGALASWLIMLCAFTAVVAAARRG